MFFGVLFAFGAGTLLTVHAQKGEPVNGSNETLVERNGKILVESIINSPPEPPVGIIRATYVSPGPGEFSTSKNLTVPAYDWVFGCSSVSAAMIAGYYDNNGYPNMYAGPANGGVAPMDNEIWPTWSDGIKTYPNLPLAASHQGVDGRSIKGSIDDYWVSYDSTDSDPYITGGWPQHTWDGTAIGDYMMTSQSAFNNKDGSTRFMYWDDGRKLLCADMVPNGDTTDGTLGRKAFYEARGYTVVECYNQRTDN